LALCNLLDKIIDAHLAKLVYFSKVLLKQYNCLFLPMQHLSKWYREDLRVCRSLLIFLKRMLNSSTRKNLLALLACLDALLNE